MEANTPKFPNAVGSPCPADIAFKELLTCLIRRSHKTRKDIAKEMSTLTGMRISKRMIDDWTCPSKPARFPAFLVPVFSQVIGDETLQRELMSERQRKRCEVGKQVLTSRDLWEALAPALAKRWARYLREKSKRTRKG
jgi:hypothetical protein